MLFNVFLFQSFLTEEVLKLYNLKREHNQKTDWQKMLKFGRKKRDRVDHILVRHVIIERHRADDAGLNSLEECVCVELLSNSF